MPKTLLLTLLLFPVFLFAQKVNKSPYEVNYISEKAYLHFDKPYYAIGDTIYFKAYVTLAAGHKLSAMSGVLYADLIGPDHKIIRSVKLPITAGTAWGDFTLADSLKSGEYHVRAYTQWMRNEGESSFFDREITVGGSPDQKTAKKEIEKYDIQFMPEGGSLVTGNYSKIAFKAIGANGLGISVKGVLTDNTGLEINTFASAHLGVGSFSLVPEAGKTYSAKVTFADGSSKIVDLPKASLIGYTISLNNNDADTIRIRVTAGGASSLDHVRLVAQSGGMVYYAAENQQTGGKFFSAVIPKSKFPSGIVQFTLLSATGEPMNERLAFINNHDQLSLNPKTDRQKYNTREKVNFSISTKDKANKVAPGSFSVSVTDESKVPVDSLNEHTILTDLFLTSDLRGIIEQPNYYFVNSDEKVQTDLDNLMLTQGYRHFEWKRVLNKEQTEPKFPVEKSIQISGIVKKGSKPLPNAKVTLLSKTGGMFLIDTVTNNEGRFIFKDLVFADSTKFVVQAKVDKGQDDVKLDLDTVSSPGVSVFESPVYGQQKEIEAYTINQKQFFEEQKKYGINKHDVILKEVKVEAKRESKIPHSENLNGAGNADHVLTAKDLEKFLCAKLADCLQGVIPNVIFRNGYAINQRIGMGDKGRMAIVIDGTFVDEDMFNDLNPNDIEGIEVVMGPHYGAIYGSRMANGGIIVTTKRAKKTNNYYRYAPGVVTYMPKGFYKAREFYAPQYDNPKTNPKIPDLRSTIYWNPNIITDKDGKASFSYFNADGKGTYRVVIEGIDADGNIGRAVYHYKVE